MKRYVCLFLFLFTVLGLRAQTLDISNCRLMKVEALLITKDNKYVANPENPIIIHFTLCYGAKSSGYASDDYIYLLGDNSDEWKSHGCLGFMDVPEAANRDTNPGSLKEDGMNLNIFFANGWRLAMFSSTWKDSGLKSDNQIVIVNDNTGRNVAYRILKCDFYDISTGKERRVCNCVPCTKTYNGTDNLFYVFTNNMYEYYVE